VGLRELYLHACANAERGDSTEACRLYEQLLQTAIDPHFRALLCNDIAALTVQAGDVDAGRRGFEAALAVDAECMCARENLAILLADTGPVVASAAQASLLLPKTPEIGASSASAKVAIVSFLFNWPSTGGGIVHTVELARFLAKAGYEVRHFYVRYTAWEIGKVELQLSFPSEALEFDDASWKLCAIQDRFREAVDQFHPDHVIITDSWNIKPLLAEAVEGYPYILRLQAMECLCPLNNVRLLADPDGQVRQCPLHQLATPRECARCLQERGQHSGGLHQAERALAGVGTPEYHERLLRTLRQAEAVLVVNPLTEAMLSPYARRVRVVTAGMDPARFPWPPPTIESPSGKVKTVFFAGLVDEWMKGFHVLHEACSLLWQCRQDFGLVATGDPPGKVDEFTRYVGWLSQEELPRHLHAADMVVLPTVAQEALGRTAVEAMAAGRPVVASRIGGLPATVADGATGLLCEPGDAQDLARKIEKLLDDDELRQRMGLAGRRRFEEHYSWDVIIERHYKPLLGPPQRSPAEAGAFVPVIPEQVDQERLVEEISRFFQLPRAAVETMRTMYAAFHEAKGYARTLGERKTLCFEEAFVLYVLLATSRPPTLVEIGTQHGKSTRRLLDIKTLLGLPGRVVCFDLEDQVQHFSRDEAELMVRDMRGRFAQDVLRAYEPGLVFHDVNSYCLLKEVLTQTLAHAGKWALAIHDCGRGLCNPRMTLAKDDPHVTSSTGVWERHVLAEVFGIADPLSERLDQLETATHRLVIFGTPQGLAVLLPK
jgi:glycosyltransferase involved in cell wall biosynthesis